MSAPHPIQRRYLAEDLVRLRPAAERRRYVASQRSGRIDPNPHQIDAVIFALDRILAGGCILADEVGLGKTIEAGLVMAQLLAEGAERILLVTPKALLGQWRQELFDLFNITATEWSEELDLARAGVILVTRDFAAGEKGAELLRSVPPFDLCVVDEAHEIFAAIYKRFDRQGNYLDDSDKAVMAGRLREVVQPSPVLLLTATPIQNSLTELWGLAQYVEPTGTLLGNLRTFREVFCAGDDRRLVEGQEHELRMRLKRICQRTLRRQAQEFMKQPFVGRRAVLFEYAMSPEEKALYDAVTAYLLEPGLCAFRGNHRWLLLIGFHRQMASSVPALIRSLAKVAERLERQLSGSLDVQTLDEAGEALLEDLEEDEWTDSTLYEEEAPPPERIKAELERVRRFIEQAGALPTDSKGEALIRAVRLVLDRAERGEGSGKLVIFTESLTTQEYLRDLLIEQGPLRGSDVTLFRGDNSGPRAQQALARWQREVLPRLPVTARPSQEIAIRLALVHEFRTRSKVFISTEAGAKGLNLQFADTLINVDLPWNPQRIEQRIGRIHRYGQQRDVTVINFLAKDNQAQRLTFDILSQKLDLFGTVLDASDVVLHEPSSDTPETLAGALGADFEAHLRRIYRRARTFDEIEEELARLRDSMDAQRSRFEAIHRRTAGLIESRFDDQVKETFRRIQSELPVELAAFDAHLERVVRNYLEASGIGFVRHQEPGRISLEITADDRLPPELRSGLNAVVGDAQGLDDVDPLHLGHPLVTAAVEEARRATRGPFAVRVRLPGQAPGALRDRVGQRGRLRLLRVRYQGFEPVETLVPVGVFEADGLPVHPETAQMVLEGQLEPIERLLVAVADEDLDDAVDEVLFVAQADASRREQERFQRLVDQIETSIEDRILVLERQRARQVERVSAGEKRRDAAIGSEIRTQAETALKRDTTRLEAIDAELTRLRERNDAQYARWLQRAHQQRSQPPEVETVFEVELELA